MSEREDEEGWRSGEGVPAVVVVKVVTGKTVVVEAIVVVAVVVGVVLAQPACAFTVSSIKVTAAVSA